MTNKMPLRLTILHFAQRFLIDAVTFIPPISFNTSWTNLPGSKPPLVQQSSYYTCFTRFRPDSLPKSWYCQNDGASFGDR